jgi:hypothetical protein
MSGVGIMLGRREVSTSAPAVSRIWAMAASPTMLAVSSGDSPS